MCTWVGLIANNVEIHRLDFISTIDNAGKLGPSSELETILEVIQTK